MSLSRKEFSIKQDNFSVEYVIRLIHASSEYTKRRLKKFCDY